MLTEPTGEEQPPSPTQNMAENRQTELFRIRETNGEVTMKKISPTSLPHFHGLASKGHNTFMFKFVVVYKTYDYTYDE